MRHARASFWLLFAAGCNSILGITEGKPAPQGESCILSSDCPTDGHICIFKICSPPCAADRDCPMGSRCLANELGAACIASSKASCSEAGSECPVGTKCTDGTCRTTCDASESCLPDQTCVEMACQGTDKKHDPNAMIDGTAGHQASGGDTSEPGAGGAPAGGADPMGGTAGNAGSPAAGGNQAGRCRLGVSKLGACRLGSN